MWFIISLVITVLLIAGAVWLRNRWIIDSFNSYGVYGTMAGLYLYKKYGLWHIGNKNTEATTGETPAIEARPERKEAFAH